MPAGKKNDSVERTQITHLHHEKVDHILIRPCPPTRPLGAIKRIRRANPTSTPYSTSWCLGVVGFVEATEQWLCLMGYISWAKFSRRGGLISWPNCNGRAELVRLSRPKNSTTPQSTVGCLVGRRIGRVTERRQCFLATEIRGNIRCLVGGDGMTNW